MSRVYNFSAGPAALPEEVLREAAEETGAVLIETAALFDDGAGNLPAEVSTDGVHLTHSYYLQWLDYLREVSVP